MSGSSLLRKITRQISPHHNPEGITFGRAKPRTATAVAPTNTNTNTYVTGLAEKLAQYEVEHVEQTNNNTTITKRPTSVARKQESQNPSKQRSKARLTGARVAELVEAAAAAPEGM
ncbi:LAME_0H06590g1_1 [Lachancea meyersii CBS 8951]|uniref:LAME_0H06590g1_1 n=1 Tax=Lachancea meyersii CBS 8951 TaxID=1266667 RepID=A0A1G4KEU0_9SACH|nr:LAME_0H06590g1_1 [Lachancea meyersii CBS 8951]